MGNHEYCVECGESDFHWGRPCDPKKLAIKEKERKQQKEREKRLQEECLKLRKRLEAEGHSVWNKGTVLEVTPTLPGEKIYRATNCSNCGSKLPHKCATKGCPYDPGGNGWDCYKYCNECDRSGKR